MHPTADPAGLRPAATPAAPPATLDGEGRSWASVGSPTVVFVGMPKRAEFDQLALPVTVHGLRMRLNVHASPMRDQPCRLLTKTHQAGGFTVIFQHWGWAHPDDADLPAFLAAQAQPEAA